MCVTLVSMLRYRSAVCSNGCYRYSIYRTVITTVVDVGSFPQPSLSADSPTSKRGVLLLPCPIVLDHPSINPSILTLDLQGSLRSFGFKNEVVITMWTIFIAVLELFHVFPKCFLALLAHEGHLHSTCEFMVFLLAMALCTVEPFSAAGRSYGDLCIENVLARRDQSSLCVTG